MASVASVWAGGECAAWTLEPKRGGVRRRSPRLYARADTRQDRAEKWCIRAAPTLEMGGCGGCWWRARGRTRGRVVGVRVVRVRRVRRGGVPNKVHVRAAARTKLGAPLVLDADRAVVADGFERSLGSVEPAETAGFDRLVSVFDLGEIEDAGGAVGGREALS